MLEFPYCHGGFSGIVSDVSGKRLCKLNGKNHPKFVAAAACFACPYSNADMAGELLPICKPPEPDFACHHRGAIVRRETCEICGDRKGKQVEVYACSVHGECSIHRYRNGKGPTSCVSCQNRQANDLPPLAGQANLMLHVYPRKETRDIWQSQLAMIRESLPQFDGLKLLSIATDEMTAEGDIDPAGWTTIHVAPNDPDRWELPGWEWAMAMLKDQPGFTVRLHCKGVVRGCPEPRHVRWWQLAYQSMLDVPRVRQSLQSHILAGVFRRNVFAGNLSVPWHFAGSFYAFRHDQVFARAWQPRRRDSWAVERWPAEIAKRHEADCLRFDGCGNLYLANAWKVSPDVTQVVSPKEKKNGRQVSGLVSDTPAILLAAPRAAVSDADSTAEKQVTTPMPKVSIVVPVWNEAPRVEKCLRSIQAQTFGDFECVIVDDGSTDGSESVIRRVVGADDRFTYLRKEHSGIGATLNVGFERCRADLLTWISADSWVLPEFLARLKAALDASPDKVMAYSDWHHFDEPTGKTITVHEPEYDRKSLQSRCRIGPCWLFRADAKRKAGSYVDDPCEDYYMHLRLSEFGDFVHVPAVLGAWRNHPGNTSTRICNPTHWAANSVVKAKARWQQAKYRVAYLCPNLDAASVGWLHMNAINDLSDDFAVRHILGDVTHVTPGVDARLSTSPGGPVLTDEARKILGEADLIHINSQYPDSNAAIASLIADKPLVIHMHASRWQRSPARLRYWKERGVPVLTCTPGHAIARWLPNVIPIGSEHLTYAAYYTPAQRTNQKLRLLCHHNYAAGKGVSQLAELLDGMDEVLFSRKLKARLEWSLSADKKLSLLDHLALKKPFDICIDTMTHGYCGMASWESMAMAQAVVCRMDEQAQQEYRRCFGSVPPIFNPRTVDDLVECLLPLIETPSLAVEAGQANREWIQANYTAAKILPMYEAIYTEAIHARV